VIKRSQKWDRSCDFLVDLDDFELLDKEGHRLLYGGANFLRTTQSGLCVIDTGVHCIA
jgi:hypothetical protein